MNKPSRSFGKTILTSIPLLSAIPQKLINLGDETSAESVYPSCQKHFLAIEIDSETRSVSQAHWIKSQKFYDSEKPGDQSAAKFCALSEKNFIKFWQDF